MLHRPIRIVISGGGTGGHIFPAIAIADALRKQKPDAVVLFIGAKGRMEMEKVPKAGYQIEGLWISGFQRKLTLKNLSFPLKVISSLWKARKILKQFKPDVVVGVGGYASGPTLRAAIQLGIPTLIQEQNSFPGVTNRILGKKAGRICVAYDKMDKWFPANKTVLTGNPLRLGAVDIEGKRDEAKKFFQLPEGPVILVVGGSQGALGINLALSEKLNQLVQSGMKMIWQTGISYAKFAEDQVQKMQAADNVKVLTFIERMDLAYALADIVVSRAGAIAISELAVVQKPVIFVPLPTAAEDHQTKNAMKLKNANAAQMVENAKAIDELVPEIIKLSKDKTTAEKMARSIGGFAQLDAANLIVNEILMLVKDEIR